MFARSPAGMMFAHNCTGGGLTPVGAFFTIVYAVRLLGPVVLREYGAGACQAKCFWMEVSLTNLCCSFGLVTFWLCFSISLLRYLCTASRVMFSAKSIL